ncbi:MAG: hypothetical protein GX350_02255 [Erysipelotrichaceae bacterium]|nr:hypothetical protein [Erysipelotrichaceae bacterium]
MKLYPSATKTLLMHLLVGGVTSVLFFLLFGYPYSPFDPAKHILLLVIPLVIALIIALVAIRTTSYEINKKKIIHRRGRKVYEYKFSMIVYVDDEYTRKHKILRFYTNKGDEIFLPLDKNMLLYEIVQKNVGYLWSFEQLKEKFPKASK